MTEPRPDGECIEFLQDGVSAPLTASTGRSRRRPAPPAAAPRSRRGRLHGGSFLLEKEIIDEHKLDAIIKKNATGHPKLREFIQDFKPKF